MNYMNKDQEIPISPRLADSLELAARKCIRSQAFVTQTVPFIAHITAMIMLPRQTRLFGLASEDPLIDNVLNSTGHNEGLAGP